MCVFWSTVSYNDSESGGMTILTLEILYMHVCCVDKYMYMH